jgi:hypothetical protein
MAHAATPEKPKVPVSAPPPDAENPALIDAQKTFRIAMIGAVLFCSAALYIILRTRMG